MIRSYSPFQLWGIIMTIKLYLAFINKKIRIYKLFMKHFFSIEPKFYRKHCNEARS
jgi:hypothetical protein